MLRPVVRKGGVEPPPHYWDTDLNRARLPIPPLARALELYELACLYVKLAVSFVMEIPIYLAVLIQAENAASFQALSNQCRPCLVQ